MVEIPGDQLKVGPIEAIDGTPVVDVKPVLPGNLLEHAEGMHAGLAKILIDRTIALHAGPRRAVKPQRRRYKLNRAMTVHYAH